jgi:hypothetical protein
MATIPLLLGSVHSGGRGELAVMNSADRDDKKPLESVLWSDDWGIPQADLTEEQATRRGLVLLRGRWVPESD